MIDSDQIRAARALLRWSAEELAKRAQVSLSTIRRMEADSGIPSTSAKNLEAVERSLSDAGIEFIAKNGGGTGVRWKKK